MNNKILADICYSIADTFSDLDLYHMELCFNGKFDGKTLSVFNSPHEVISLASVALEGITVEDEKFIMALDNLRMFNRWFGGAFDRTVKLIEEINGKEAA